MKNKIYATNMPGRGVSLLAQPRQDIASIYKDVALRAGGLIGVAARWVAAFQTLGLAPDGATHDGLHVGSYVPVGRSRVAQHPDA